MLKKKKKKGLRAWVFIVLKFSSRGKTWPCMSSSFGQESQNSQDFMLNLKERAFCSRKWADFVSLRSSQWGMLPLPERAGCTVPSLLPTASMKCVTPTFYVSPAIVFKFTLFDQRHKATLMVVGLLWSHRSGLVCGIRLWGRVRLSQAPSDHLTDTAQNRKDSRIHVFIFLNNLSATWTSFQQFVRHWGQHRGLLWVHKPTTTVWETLAKPPPWWMEIWRQLVEFARVASALPLSSLLAPSFLAKQWIIRAEVESEAKYKLFMHMTHLNIFMYVYSSYLNKILHLILNLHSYLKSSLTKSER